MQTEIIMNDPCLHFITKTPMLSQTVFTALLRKGLNNPVFLFNLSSDDVNTVEDTKFEKRQ